MITTVTMNPCIDKTIWVDGFAYGGTNRVVETRTDLAGKGLNVSMALKALGIRSTAVSFDFSEDAGAMGAMLEGMGIDAVLPKAIGALRTNLKVFERGARVMTELNEGGAAISAAALAEIEAEILRVAEVSSVLVLSGSLPPNVPATFYRDIMRTAARPGLRVFVDTSGEALREALTARPFAIKPNLEELERLAGRTLSTRRERIQAARETLATGVAVESGAEICCLSLGAEGALIASQSQGYFAAALPVDVKSAQGAGDSMVAGMIAAVAEGKGVADMLRSAVASASATIVREGTRFGHLEDYERLRQMVQIEALG